MAMNVQNDNWDEEAELNTTINTTPLVDVMLVLLIIFLVTIPVILKIHPVQLPNARNIATITKPENIVIVVDKEENIFYNNEPVEASELKGRFEGALRRAQAKGLSAVNMPEVHIRGDREAHFRAIGRVIFAAQQAGILKVGFLTEPRNQE
jgi:biopolymer transport protein ExbD